MDEAPVFSYGRYTVTRKAGKGCIV